MYNEDIPHIDDIVYAPFSPSRVGKIVSINAKSNHVIVEKANGVRFGASPRHLMCFRTLIEDHERKLQTHKDRLTALGG